MGSLDGKVAIVTGAGRGLGRSHALLLAEHGAKVVVNDLGGEWDGSGEDSRPAQQVVEEIKAAGGDAAANYDSAADWSGAEKLIRQAIDSFGGLDILINNAGILRDKMSFNMDESDWDSVINVHLKGHFAPSHHAARYWREKAKAGEALSARIVNTASEAGLYGNAGQANYGAAKAGIAALTIVMARELQRYGVTVNAISPRAAHAHDRDDLRRRVRRQGRLRHVRPRERLAAGGVAVHRRRRRRERSELRRVRRPDLHDVGVVGRRHGRQGRPVDHRGAVRQEGRAVQDQGQRRPSVRSGLTRWPTSP